MTTSDSECYSEWQRVTISANSSFFRIREESRTKHPKENSLNFKEDLEQMRYIELRAEGSPLTVKSRNCRSSLQIFLKIGFLKMLGVFTEKPFVGLQVCASNSIKNRLQRWYFSVNIAKFLKTFFSIDTSDGCSCSWDISLFCDTYNFENLWR